MNEPSVDPLISRAMNKFLLSNALANRAKQIAEGSLPYIESSDNPSPIVLAMREITADKVRIKIMEGPRPKVERLIFEAPDTSPSLEKEKKKKKKA